MRAGTTTLFRALQQSPDIVVPIRKEIHYFDLQYGQGPSWYLGHYPLVWRQGGRFITGEATPYLSYFPPAAQRVHELLPHAKILMILRDPVDRAESHYLMQQGKHETRPFMEAATSTAEVDRIHAQLVGGECVSDVDLRSHRLFSYLQRGRYAEQLSRWLILYGPQQLMTIDFDDLVQDQQGVLDTVAEFLEIRSPRRPRVVHLNLRKASRGANDGYVPVSTSDRADLRSYFADADVALERLLGRKMRWMP